MVSIKKKSSTMKTYTLAVGDKRAKRVSRLVKKKTVKVTTYEAHFFHCRESLPPHCSNTVLSQFGFNASVLRFFNAIIDFRHIQI